MNEKVLITRKRRDYKKWPFQLLWRLIRRTTRQISANQHIVCGRTLLTIYITIHIFLIFKPLDFSRPHSMGFLQFAFFYAEDHFFKVQQVVQDRLRVR